MYVRSVSKKFWARRIPTSRKKLDNYRKVNVCGGTECMILRPQLLKRFLTVTHKSSQIYPRHLRHFLPITTATTERSFSALRRLKTYLRSTMKEDRLSGLALMDIHKHWMCQSVRKTSLTILQHPETEGWNFFFSYSD